MCATSQGSLLADRGLGHIVHHHTAHKHSLSISPKLNKYIHLSSCFVCLTRLPPLDPLTTSGDLAHTPYLSHSGELTFQPTLSFSLICTSVPGLGEGLEYQLSKDCHPFGNVEQSPPQIVNRVLGYTDTKH